jgi:flagellar biosynthetic protein FlhB
MSENESAGEKTEQPTEKRLRDAREQGNLPRSRELGTAAVFGAGVLAVMAMSGSIGRGATAWMKHGAQPGTEPAAEPEGTVRPLRRPAAAVHAGDRTAGAGLPAGQLRRPLVMGGLRWSQKALLPDINRMNPMSGLKRLYGPEAIAEFTKSLLRVAFVGSPPGWWSGPASTPCAG